MSKNREKEDKNAKPFNYMMLDVSTMRQRYRDGRRPIKLSLTPWLFQGLEQIGVIESVVNENGRIVAKKGGFGSSFAEFSIEMMLALLTTSGENTYDFNPLATRIKDVLGNKQAETFIDNMKKLIAAIDDPTN